MPPSQPTQGKLLLLLRDWKRAVPGREVTLVGGDAHISGHTFIFDGSERLFRQVVTSPMSNLRLKPHEFWVFLAVAEIDSHLPLPNGQALSFQHRNFLNERSYIRISLGRQGVVDATHITASDEAGSELGACVRENVQTTL